MTFGAGHPPHASALFTDLYELKMLQAYHRERMEDIAVFDLFVRKLPPERNFLLAAGIDDALRYLEELHFEEAELAYLNSLGYFTTEFLDWLSGFRFSGSVWAVPEGTPMFADEPILEVVAPIAEAQLVETYLLNQISFQTLVASKGVRSVLAARGKPVIDFGARRAQGTDAALKGARALHIAGFQSTSNMLAGLRYGLPVTGTMAHSYIEAHDDEAGAFREFAALYPDTTLLVDTYDTEAGVRRVVELAQQLGADFQVRSIRLDSGDLRALAHRAREMLDAAGLTRVGIIASGGLDEYVIAALVNAGAPIDAYAVGTSVITSADAPKLDTAYKLVEYAGRGCMKLSIHKATLPG
ncbi:MAG: nicotinate phosphoribosyltransferase, partial [Porticoccaceae bacterium]